MTPLTAPASVRLLRRRDAAKFLGLSEERLAQLAASGRGPAYHRVPGGRTVLYSEATLLEWLGDPVKSTTEARARETAHAAA
jgi:hypothetical protein